MRTAREVLCVLPEASVSPCASLRTARGDQAIERSLCLQHLGDREAGASEVCRSGPHESVVVHRETGPTNRQRRMRPGSGRPLADPGTCLRRQRCSQATQRSQAVLATAFLASLCATGCQPVVVRAHFLHAPIRLRRDWRRSPETARWLRPLKRTMMGISAGSLLRAVHRGAWPAGGCQPGSASVRFGIIAEGDNLSLLSVGAQSGSLHCTRTVIMPR